MKLTLEERVVDEADSNFFSSRLRRITLPAPDWKGLRVGGNEKLRSSDGGLRSREKASTYPMRGELLRKGNLTGLAQELSNKSIIYMVERRRLAADLY